MFHGSLRIRNIRGTSVALSMFIGGVIGSLSGGSLFVGLDIIKKLDNICFCFAVSF